MLDFIVLVWNEVITKPMTNSLLMLYVFLGSNLGLAIIAFTILVRGATYKLVVRQLRQTRKMQDLGPLCGSSMTGIRTTPSSGNKRS